MLGSSVVLLIVSVANCNYAGGMVAADLVPRPIAPPQVKAGDTVGFISPASPPYYIYMPSTYKQHVEDAMGQLGLHVKFGKHAFDEFGYLAGTDYERIEDVHAMFADPSVSMIIANRGGYGCARIIDMLNYTLIAENPKVLVGYSDLTALLNAINTKTGMTTFHGPMGIDTWWGGDHSLNAEYLQRLVMRAESGITYHNLPLYNTITIRKGTARGRLIGGNSAVLAGIVGSAYTPKEAFSGAILFLEDVGEAPYRIDRYLTQLHLAGCLDALNGFVWGRCTDCLPSNASESLTLMQVLQEKILPLGIPAFFGAQFGHELVSQFSLPVGVKAEIDAAKGIISILEAAVSTT